MSTSQVTAPGANRATDPLAKLRIQRSQTRRPRSAFRRFMTAVLTLIVLLSCAAGGLAVAVRNGWISSRPEWLSVPDIIQPRPEVRLAVVNVESGRAADATVVATGYLESRRQAKIGARAPGRIEVIHVEEGSRVEAGQELAVLEHADLEASLAAVAAMRDRARAELLEQDVTIQKSKRQLERAERLRESKGVSDTEFDEARFGYQGAVARHTSLTAAAALADARVREAEQMKANMFIRAPFRGTVISKDAEVGESILPGGMGEASGRGSVVTVADLDHLEVDCDVKEDYISRIQAEQSAEVAVDAVPGRRYRGRVRKIIPMGDRARATIKVKVEILDVNDLLFPEMSATVYFLPTATEEPAETAPRRRVFCDKEAIQEDAEGTFVWSLDENQHLRRVGVTTGQARDRRVEITEGLAGNERVVITPSGLQPGQAVKLSP